jgi:2'-5' RNA ligase
MRAFFGLLPDAKTKMAIDVWRNKACSHLDAQCLRPNFMSP